MEGVAACPVQAGLISAFTKATKQQSGNWLCFPPLPVGRGKDRDITELACQQQPRLQRPRRRSSRDSPAARQRPVCVHRTPADLAGAPPPRILCDRRDPPAPPGVPRLPDRRGLYRCPPSWLCLPQAEPSLQGNVRRKGNPLALRTLLCSVTSDAETAGLQPSRLLGPWNFPARLLRWVATSSSRGSSQHRDRIQVSCTGRRIIYLRSTWEAPLPCW